MITFKHVRVLPKGTECLHNEELWQMTSHVLESVDEQGPESFQLGQPQISPEVPACTTWSRSIIDIITYDTFMITFKHARVLPSISSGGAFTVKGHESQA